MLTTNPNQKPNHYNPLLFKRLTRFYPLLVRIIAFFPNKAYTLLPLSFFTRKRVENTPRAFLRIFRFIPNQSLRLSPKTLLLLEMCWLAFLVSILLSLQIILTTPHPLSLQGAAGDEAISSHYPVIARSKATKQSQP